MLAALDKGVKGGKWFSLIDKVCNPKNLQSAWMKVRRNAGSAGVDRQTVKKFELHSERYLAEIREELCADKYVPKPALRRWINKAGTQKMRPLGIPTVKDRVVQGAVRQVIEPIWEACFSERSYGFRPGRSCKDALRRVQGLLKLGHRWVVDADIQGYFDAIPRDLLMKEVREKVADSRVLQLIEAFLSQSVMEDMEVRATDSGTPQGGVISPLLANIYLHPVDEALATSGFEMVRYADDLVILCKTEEEAQQALELLTALMTERGLTLHPEKTRLVNEAAPNEGFDFLGYHFERGTKWPRKKSMAQIRETIRQRTPRRGGRSLQAVIASINPILKGWYQYFKESNPMAFKDLDGWTRKRLRSILRIHAKIRGCAKNYGKDQTRWPIAFFNQLGLFNLRDAYDDMRQPRCGTH
ncbi:MAG TPA: group II intron reverse transcriptase/maturase [Planctomycetota bacterium]|nr:group II intron reverse transcriptase/maturase [Planctomycetota bacterium]